MLGVQRKEYFFADHVEFNDELFLQYLNLFQFFQKLWRNLAQYELCIIILKIAIFYAKLQYASDPNYAKK